MYVTVNQKANIIIDIMEYVVFVGLCKRLFNIVVLCINKFVIGVTSHFYAV